MNGPRVLLIDDNAALRQMTQRRLLRHGIEIELADDGESGLRMIRAAPPDVLLLDMNLPGKDGWSLAQEIKADPSTQSIAIIAITAHAMRGDRERALAAGCDDYVSKPIDFDTLVAMIRKLVASS